MSEQQKKTRTEILAALRMGVCTLIYKKLDGETRVAVGTLDANQIPEDRLPKRKENLETASARTAPGEEDLVHYYDLVAKGWRCFFPENLQSLTVG